MEQASAGGTWEDSAAGPLVVRAWGCSVLGWPPASKEGLGPLLYTPDVLVVKFTEDFALGLVFPSLLHLGDTVTGGSCDVTG